MTNIRTSTFIDECPDWCASGADHSQPGDHESLLASVDDKGPSVNLETCIETGVEVTLWVGGSPVLTVPVDDAERQLTELAQILVTAVHRLQIIEEPSAR